MPPDNAVLSRRRGGRRGEEEEEEEEERGDNEFRVRAADDRCRALSDR